VGSNSTLALVPPTAPDAGSGSRITHPAVTFLVAGAASVAFAASFGVNYGIENQVVYLLKSLTIVHPDLLRNDWFVHNVTQYHIAFAYLGAALIALDPSGWLLALVHIAVVTAGSLFVFGLVRSLTEPWLALPTFLCVMTIWFITRTTAVSSVYVFNFIFQPSALGSLGVLGALYYFARGRWLASGVWLAVAGLFHANYLVLSVPVFGLAHLALGREGLLQRFARQLGPLGAVVIVSLPAILETAASGETAARAHEILFKIRAPHHYDPRSFDRSFMLSAAWQMIGFGAGLPFLRGRMRTPGGRVGAIYMALMVVIWTGTVFTTLLYVPQVAQMLVWRFAPFCDLLGALLFCVALVYLIAEPSGVRRYPPAAWGLIVSGIGLVCVFQRSANQDLAKLVVAFGAVAALIAVFVSAAAYSRLSFLPALDRLWSRHRAWVILMLSVVPLAAFAPARLRNVPRRSSLIHELAGRPEVELIDWMRTRSPRDAVFLTPPDVESLRFRGQRAIVVDWKATPIIPRELIAWHDRLNDVCGREVKSADDLANYDALDRERLEQLKAKYHLDYVVVRRGNEERLGEYRVELKNDAYVVLSL